MKISELEVKDYLVRASGAEANSFILLNYAENDSTDPVTYQISLNELANTLITKHQLVSYNSTNNSLNSTTYSNNEYTNVNDLGRYITSDDRTVLDTAITNVAYDGTNKKLTASIRGGAAADIVTTASLLSDMNLNITQITNTAGKTIATIDESNGKVSATFQDIEIAQSQVTNLTTALGNKLETSLKGANSGLAELDENGKVPTAQLPSYVDAAYTHAVTNKGSAYTSGLYKITTNSEGHITAATAVEKSDITSLGIPSSDTTYEMDGTYDASTNKVATVSTVTSATSGLYTKPVGGIPSTDLADSYIKLPELPTTDGAYTLQVVIATGEDPVFSWVAQTT